jgi:hypothetical protein
VTGAEFSGVDIDLLADYVGGALDGTPDKARVADLIVDDPAWRDAHALLAGGVATVGLQLSTFGAVPEPMPADVFARLDAALTAASAPTVSTDDHIDLTAVSASAVTNDDHVDLAQPSRPAQSAAAGDGAGSLVVDGVSGAAVGGTEMRTGSDAVAPVRRLDAVRDRRRGRQLRWAAPIGIAAGLLAFVGFGVQQARNNSSQDAGSSSAESAPQAAAPNAASDLALPTLPGPGTHVLASGLDYQRATLSQVGAQPAAGRSAETEAFSSRKNAPMGALDEDADALSRLRVQQALLKCIDAITTENGAGAITAQTVDFAHFAGTPAVIVQFTAGNGTWVWAAGAECGRPAAGADKLAAVKVG